jgi:hypothetical protein
MGKIGAPKTENLSFSAFAFLLIINMAAHPVNFGMLQGVKVLLSLCNGLQIKSR